ncbi:MAG: aminopeptidase P family protein [Acidobacteriaceae bacterium]|nr:aminopeptidase P family protein [Acidobacteriaceae bacterium]
MDAHDELSLRRKRLLETLPSVRAGAFLVTALVNVRYLSGFTGSNGILLLTPSRSLLFTDPRYQSQAPGESDCDVIVAKGNLSKEVASWVKRLRLRSIAFEENRISFAEYQHLKEVAAPARFKPVAAAIEELRMLKSPVEIATIRASVQLNSAALEHALRRFRPSMTELDLAAEIEYRMRRLGADGPAFDTIVASGRRTALPHARPTGHPIQADCLLLVDVGATVAGYASDMTRTFAVGRLNPKLRRMYKAVLESQLAALDAVRPGVSCASIDSAARDVLRRYGLEKFFIHSTGHGLGLEIHERPRLGHKERVKLQSGMVVTIEPGVYQPEIGGVRIEDTVVVTGRGCEILTPTGKELVVL